MFFVLYGCSRFPYLDFGDVPPGCKAADEIVKKKKKKVKMFPHNVAKRNRRDTERISDF